MHISDRVVGAPTPIVSVRPVVLPALGRGEDVQVRVSAPATGRELPIIVFSHGFGLSLDGNRPLVDFWAAHGFVVIQPTHLDSRTLSLAPDDPRTPLIWRFRVEDLTRILDGLDRIGASLPGLSGRLDRCRIAAAGHSWGGQTASTLLGARVLDPYGIPGEDLSDSRIKSGRAACPDGRGRSRPDSVRSRALPIHEPELRGHDHAGPRDRGGSRPVCPVHSGS